MGESEEIEVIMSIMSHYGWKWRNQVSEQYDIKACETYGWKWRNQVSEQYDIKACKNQVWDFWALNYLGSQFICSGLEDFLLWVVLDRETQSNT